MISKRALEDYLNRKLDSFIWMKSLSKDILYDEINQFKVKPDFKVDLWQHQLVSFYLGMCYPEFLFLLDPGLGKTSIAVNLIKQRIREKKIERAIVTVPRLINLDTWQREIEKHSDLEPFIIEGTSEEKWERISNPRGEIVVIDYPGIQFALTKRIKHGKKSKLVIDESKIKQLQNTYQFINIDESHKVKNGKTLRFELLWKLTKTISYRYASTGTLFGRNPEDAFYQFKMIDKGETLGEYITAFRDIFFDQKQNYFGGIDYVFNKRMTDTLNKMLQHRSIRYLDSEVPETDLPPVVFRRISVKFSQDQREQYLRTVEGKVEAVKSDLKLENIYIKLRQITAGFLSWKDEYGEHLIKFENNPKLQWLEEFLESTGDHKIVITHEYTESGRLINDLCKSLGYKTEWLYGGTKNPRDAINRFKKNPECKVFIMNSESGGTGVDSLQSVSKYLVFYESPVSPITRHQTLKRIHRSGQQQRCFIYDLVMEHSVDCRILDFIDEGKSLYEAIVNKSISVKELI